MLRQNPPQHDRLAYAGINGSTIQKAIFVQIAFCFHYGAAVGVASGSSGKFSQTAS
jgi:hypothetical protein